GGVLGSGPVGPAAGTVDSARHGADAEIADAVLAAFDGADLVLLPGFPLSHPDHRWLVDTLAARDAFAGLRHAFYAEQPYTTRSGERPPGFLALPPDARSRLAQPRAIRRPRSPLP